MAYTKKNPPGKWIEITPRHRLHVINQGKEGISSTVVFEHGAGGSTLMWSLVYPEIAKHTRVIVYDRSGYGWSDRGPFPRTNEKCVEELHKLLNATQTKGPIILVGHSYGGMNARLYADRYPEQVKGIVLVDATHEDELTDRFPREHVKGQQMAAKMMGTLATMARVGLLQTMAFCKIIPGFSNSIRLCSKDIQKSLWNISFQSKALTSAHSEFVHMSQGYELVRNTKPLHNLPLTVIVAGIVDQFAPGTSKEVQEEIKQTLRDVAEETAQISTKGKLVIAEKSSHNIHLEQPEIVINAIMEMVAAVRS